MSPKKPAALFPGLASWCFCGDFNELFPFFQHSPVVIRNVLPSTSIHVLLRDLLLLLLLLLLLFAPAPVVRSRLLLLVLLLLLLFLQLLLLRPEGPGVHRHGPHGAEALQLVRSLVSQGVVSENIPRKKGLEINATMNSKSNL